MIQKIKKYFVSFVAVAALLFPLAAPAVAFAETTVPAPSGDLRSNFCNGVDISVSGSNGCSGTDTANDSVNNAVKLGLNLFSAIVGIISIVMIIIGGIRYITSGGDSGKVTAAQNTVVYAVIGLVVVALAQIIVKFVLGRFTNG